MGNNRDPTQLQRLDERGDVGRIVTAGVGRRNRPLASTMTSQVRSDNIHVSRDFPRRVIPYVCVSRTSVQQQAGCFAPDGTRPAKIMNIESVYRDVSVGWFSLHTFA